MANGGPPIRSQLVLTLVASLVLVVAPPVRVSTLPAEARPKNPELRATLGRASLSIGSSTGMLPS
jgi:hypothetical protein